MKMRKLSVILMVMVMFISNGLIGKQVRQVSIEDIRNSPQSYRDEVVRVEGLVTIYVPARANTTAYYVLQGDYGATIQVNTPASAPETNQKYCVTGILYVRFNERNNVRDYFISEQGRYEGTCNESAIISVSPKVIDFGIVDINKSKEETFNISNSGRSNLELKEISISNKDYFELEMPNVRILEPGNSVALKVIFTPKENSDYSSNITIYSNATNEVGSIKAEGSGIGGSFNMFYLIIFIAVLLLIGLGIALYMLKKRPDEKTANQSKPAQKPAQDNEPQKSPEMKDYETVKIPIITSKTAKIFPGEFEILSGTDQGKKFKVQAKQTSEGLIVTVGRLADSSSEHAHIQLKDDTVSRSQAELIHTNGKSYLRNKSTTNHSVVDYKEVIPESIIELHSGSQITFGKVSLRYHLT